MTTSLEQIRAAMTECLYGDPTSVVALRHRGDAAGVPTELDVLIREIDDEESWSYLGTAGMSAIPLTGPVPRAELMMQVEGKRRTEDLEALARRLGEIAVAPFRKPFVLREEMILDDLDFPLFIGMTSAAIARWTGEHDALPGVEPEVVLLEVSPLFPREADEVRKIGVQEAFRRFARAGVNRRDPDRDEVRLEDHAAGSTEEQYDEDVVVRSIDAIWDELEPWLAANAPRIHGGLRPGASTEQIAKLEAAIGRPLTPELRAWFLRHDGARGLDAYDFLQIAGVESQWRDWNELVEDGSFTDGRVPADETGRVFQPVWWHRGWLPVAQDSANNLICIDLEPGPYGVVGQVLFWENTTGPEASRLPSIAAWFDGLLQDLLEGVRYVDDEGFIQRRYS